MTRHTTSRSFLGIGLCWLLVSGFALESLALTQAELDAGRNLWNSFGSDDYDYFMQRSCFCFGDFVRPGLVEVRSGAITSVTDADTFQPLDPQFFLTVDGLFGELQNAIDTSAFNIQAQFDNALGYPTSFSIDYIQNVADDEIAYTAADVHFVACDLDADGDCDNADIDILYAADGDIDQWLADASTIDNPANPGAAFTFKRGDANLDGSVDSTDLGLLLNNFGQSGGNAGLWGGGDTDDSGNVDSTDLGLLLNNFNFTSAAALGASVPEPNSSVLCLILAGLMFTTRRPNRS